MAISSTQRGAQRKAPAKAPSGQVLTSEQIARVLDQLPPIEPGDRRSVPTTPEARLALVRRLHQDLGIRAPSEALSAKQLDQLFERVGKEYGIRADFLRYMAGTESGQRQRADNGAAHGIMQIERAAHPAAYAGPVNVGNDTVANVVYGARLRAQTDLAMAAGFRSHGLPPPTRAGVVEFLGDLAYNRGPALLTSVAHYAQAQGIDVNRFADYVAGVDGTFELRDGKLRALPVAGSRVDSSGQGSVLALALAEVNSHNPVTLSARKYRDRNQDGRVTHLDVWVTRGLKYIDFLIQRASSPR
jgi:hypothetical protein